MAAKKTCPKMLRIGVSAIPQAGLGVFANLNIPEGLVFGPYEGVRDADPSREDSGYSFVVEPDTGSRYFVDAADSRTSNWLRYVNCSRCRFLLPTFGPSAPIMVLDEYAWQCCRSLWTF